MASSPKPPLNGASSPPQGAARQEDLSAWVQQYGPALRSYFLRRAPAADVDDLVQDVFLKLQQRRVGAPIENVEGYLFRTAATVLATRRRETTWMWGSQNPLEDVDGLVDDLSPERALMGKQAILLIAEAIDELPPRSAQAFILCRFENLTQEAAARRMGVSVKAVEELMRRAFKRLRERVRPSL